MASEYNLVLAEVRKALGNVTAEAVRQRRARIQRIVSMPNDIALYVLAQQLNLPLHRWVSDAEKLAQVAYFGGQVAEREAPAPPPAKAAALNGRRRGTARAATAVSIRTVDVPTVPGLTSGHAAEAKLMAERVYPLLYVFENSVRDLITRVLEARYGPSWWTTDVPPKVQEKARDRQQNETKEPWHGRRGATPIHYVDVVDLWKIINNRWGDFDPLFPSKAWIESLITSDLNVSRGPVAHMNPLGPEDIRGLEAAFSKWARQLQAKADELP